MTTTLSILWRLGLTLLALLLLASCGIEQTTPTLSPAITLPVVTSLPVATATLLRAPSATPFLGLSPSATVPSEAPTLVPPTRPANATPPAKFTVTLTDDGKTLTFQVGDRFLLDLGAIYVWQVTVADTSIVNQVANTGGKDNQALYEAFRQGSTILTATGTPACYNTVPRCLMPSRNFQLHLTVAGGSSPGLTITRADNGAKIPLIVGQTFLLNLGQDFVWTVTIDDPNIVSRAPNATAPKGAQGIYQAKKAGATVLHATGIVNCPPGQACIQIALEFRVQLTVK